MFRRLIYGGWEVGRNSAAFSLGGTCPENFIQQLRDRLTPSKPRAPSFLCGSNRSKNAKVSLALSEGKIAVGAETEGILYLVIFYIITDS